MSFTPAFPHDSIECFADDLFMVRGSVRLNPLTMLTRNMAIVRHEAEQTLLNPLRLEKSGEIRLRELGTMRRILRCVSGKADGICSARLCGSAEADD